VAFGASRRAAGVRLVGPSRENPKLVREPAAPNKPAPGTNRNATDNVPGVKSSGAPYAATAASGNGSSTGAGHAKNGNVAVMRREFTTAEATGIR